MIRDDPQGYTNGLTPVRLQVAPTGFHVQTDTPIPLNREIRQIIAAGCVVLWDLDPNYSFEGGIVGIIEDSGLQKPSPVWMRWYGYADEVWLMSDSPTRPNPGETLIALQLFGVLGQALFHNRRDDWGYPLLLSTDDPQVCELILLDALTHQFGLQKRDEIARYLESRAGTNLALAGLNF